MNGTEFFHGGVDGRLNGFLVGHVGLHKRRIGTQLRRHFRAALVVTIQNHHLAALGDNGFGRGLAQTGCSAGDHGNFIGNIHMLSLW